MTSLPGRLLAGAAAGTLATLPMTLFMELAHHALPASERYSLPPREITEVILDRAAGGEHADEPTMTTLTYTAHFGMGAAGGSLYSALAPFFPGPPIVKGVTYGITFWAANYLGVIPAFALLPPATKHPRERTELMIMAHVIWGAALGVLSESFASEKTMSPQALTNHGKMGMGA